MAYWITTHWPVENSSRPFSRHVYVKERHRTVPAPGDVVFVRESETVNGKRTDTMEWHYRGQRAMVKVGPGYGGIIGRMVVVGDRRRPVRKSDAVYNYGDLSEWQIIDCERFESARLPLAELRRVLERDGMMFTKLWRVREPWIGPLLAALDA